MGHQPGEHGHGAPATSPAEQRWYARTATQLTKPTDRLLVDIGCGEAPMAIELARAEPELARVLALDSDPDVLAAATAKIGEAGVSDRIMILEHDLGDGLEAVRTQLADADLIWASSSLHHVGDQQAVVTGLAGLLADGGRLALAEGGLTERCLPWDLGVGVPGLEVRLDAAQDRWFSQMRADLPGSVPMPYGWPSALHQAGLVDIVISSALFEEHTPLANSTRDAIVGNLSHRVGRLSTGGFLGEEDRLAWSQLLDPGSPDWLGRREDLFSLSVRTLYLGTRPG